MNWRNQPFLLTHCFAGLFMLFLVGCCPQPGNSAHLLDAPPLAQNQRITGTYEDVSADHQESLWALISSGRSLSGGKAGTQTASICFTDEGRGSVTATHIVNGIEQQEHVLLKRVGVYAYVDHPAFFSSVLFTAFGCVQVVVGIQPNGDLAIQTDPHIVGFMLILPIPADPIGVRASFHRTGS